MNLAEFCIENNLTADTFAMEVWKQSGERDRAWAEWIEAHDDSDQSWQDFVRFQYSDLMSRAAPNDGRSH